MAKDNLTTRLDKLPYRPWHFGMTITMGTGIFFDAYDVAIMSSALPVLSVLWGLDSVHTGYLGSAGYAGMVIGAIIGGTLADKLGRAKTFCFFTALYSLFMGVSITSTGFGALFAWRFVVGIGLGGLVPVATAYLAEFIPSRVRGRSLSLLNVFFGLGSGFSYLMGFMVVVPIAWQYGFAIGSLPIILAIVGWFVLPESVRFNLQKGRVDDAAKAVDKLEKELLGGATVSLDEAIEIEKAEIAGKPQSAKVPITDLFTKEVRGTTILMSVMWFCLAYATFGLLTWMPTLLASEMGYEVGSGLLWLALATFIAAAIAPLTGVLADTIGRKKTILLVYLLFAIAAFLLFMFGGVAGKFFMVLMATGINMCNAVNYAYVPENFPTRVRASGVGFASACGRVGAMIGPTLLGFILANGSVQTVLYINMGVLVFAAAIVMIFGKETNQRSLEQIESKKAV
jgi:putative MFS transporter